MQAAYLSAVSVSSSKEIDLATVLGINRGKAKCPFHDDSKASAGTFKTNKNEWMFKCHCCGSRGNVRELVHVIRGCSKAEATEFLKEVLKITVKGWRSSDGPWIESHRERLVGQADSIEALLADRPNLQRTVARDVPLYQVLVDEAVTNLFGRGVASTVTGEPIIFASEAHLAGRLGIQDRRSVRTRIYSLAVHGLIRIVPDSEIPEDLLVGAHRHRHELRNGSFGPRVRYLTIPQLDDMLLSDAEAVALRLVESGLTRGGYSYEGFLRSLGEEYHPQHSGPVSLSTAGQPAVMLGSSRASTDAACSLVRPLAVAASLDRSLTTV